MCRSILDAMLREDAQATSSAWVSMLVAKNPDVLGIASGGAPSAQSKLFLDESSRVGDIFRFRIWTAARQVAYVSERVSSSGTPLDRNSVEKALLSRAIVSKVHKGRPAQDLSFYVQSFIPLRQNGAVIGVFEVCLDQTAGEILYKQSLILTAIVIAVLVLLAGGIPLRTIYRQTLKLNEARAETVFLSDYDSLTGVPNRRLLNNLTRNALSSGQWRKKQVAVLMIDVDRFKGINDTFGNQAGDKVLKAVATRIRSAIRDEDHLARIGGDEFIVLQVNRYQPNGSSSLASNLIELLSEPYEIGGHQVVCGSSIGVSIWPQDGEDLDTLVACAGAALSKAKADGRNCARFSESGMDGKVRDRQLIEIDIRRALREERFQLAYQPLYSLQDGKLLGFEALLRWPDGWSPKSPADFIPIAEESGLINPIGAWALETACKTAARWANPLKIAVNLSPVQFRDGSVETVVKRALAISGLDPARLEVEVTESLWIQNTDSVLVQLGRLRKIGVSIALDDFGTGYSSLSYLWKFPFETVKIDQSFVREMETDLKAAAIVRSIAALGKALNLTITAEGVERPEQAAILKEAGCEKAQGFLFGRPLPAAAADALANARQMATGQETEQANLVRSLSTVAAD
ncbi:MAG TPA: EAL domain-containing protein [Terracidiphilus sp.]|jgi:diguanylate cyclase (GGDEF)-like protein